MTTLYFIGLVIFLKNKFVCNVRTKIFHETDVLLKVSTDSIPGYPSFFIMAMKVWT